MKTFDYSISSNNIHIENSYLFSKGERKKILEFLLEKKISPDSPILQRSKSSMLMEWSAHNVLYKLNYKRERTGSVDLDTDESLIRKIGYYILGTIGYIFFK